MGLLSSLDISIFVRNFLEKKDTRVYYLQGKALKVTLLRKLQACQDSNLEQIFWRDL